jgi:hypothetical protein
VIDNIISQVDQCLEEEIGAEQVDKMEEWKAELDKISSEYKVKLY